MKDMFGTRRRYDMPTAEAASSATSNARRGNIWGRLGNVARQLVRPDNLQVIGHTLQEIGGQPGRLDDLWARRASERQQSAEMSRETRELKEHQAQQQALEAVIASLTPQQQAMARLNPTAFVENLLRQTQQPEWSEPFSFEGGTAQRGADNQYRVLTRPRTAAAGGGQYPDDGYDYPEQ